MYTYLDLAGAGESQQFALVGLSSSLHSEACNALGAFDGVIHRRISQDVVCFEQLSARTELSRLFACRQQRNKIEDQRRCQFDRTDGPWSSDEIQNGGL